REGRNVFAKHVIAVDSSIRSGDEVIIVNENDKLIALGKAKLSGEEMLEYKKGVAVYVKRGVNDE
ncbi:MAG: PUA domain-containing protein, partial [Saccharolobus sp.]